MTSPVMKVSLQGPQLMPRPPVSIDDPLSLLLRVRSSTTSAPVAWIHTHVAQPSRTEHGCVQQHLLGNARALPFKR